MNNYQSVFIEDGEGNYYAVVGPGTGAPWQSEYHSEDKKTTELMAQCMEFGFLQAKSLTEKPEPVEGLLPCPFCGCDTCDKQGRKGIYWIICPRCGARGATPNSPETASREWNRRAGQRSVHRGMTPERKNHD